MVAAIAGAVAGAVLGAVTKNVVAQVFKLVEKKCELWKDFPNDIDFIKRELLMIAGAEEDQISGKGDPSAVKSISMEEMRDLAHDIEDCLDRILRYTEGQGEASFFHRFKSAGGRAGIPQFAAEVQKLKARLKAAHQRKVDYNVDGGQPSAAAQLAAVPSSTFPANTTEVGPVGIDEPKRELLELLDDIKGQPAQLNVITIVGFGGSGKSTLAKAVYDCPDVVGRFTSRAWVVASQHRGDTDTTGILAALLQQLRPGDSASGDVQADFTSYLDAQRCLIVIDDIEEQQWSDIISSFPENTKSKIIVTTTVQAVGKVCGHGNSYVYNMGTLDVKHSKKLLEAVLKGRSSGLDLSSASIVNKCDGHPLALVSVANHLLRKGMPKQKDCEEVCLCLGYHIENTTAFKKLQQVLMNNYSSMPGHLLKTCLLYTCVFPNGLPIKRNSLMRRWLAEGYVQYQHPRSASLVADQNFEHLIDRNVIRPIESSKNARARTCRPHGIMHEFMLHISTSAKFITSLDNPERSTYRHLFMENNPSSRASSVNHSQTSPACGSKSQSEKFRARSLTIYGNAGEAAEDYAKCELLRVLDLEECDDLTDDQMNSIHKLWHLKYLSLGVSISNLPSKIDKLHCLETLDVRKTKIEVLPVEVIKLPHLAHLLGKFKLGKRDWKTSELEKFVPKESNLQTLAGFVTDNNPGFPMLMARIRKLRKVKVWCDDEDSKSLADLSTSLKKFLQDGVDTGVDVRSLSLHLGTSSGNVLSSLNNSYGYLSSLKLHGALNGLTQFATSLFGVTELCLSSTNNLTSNDLSNLRKLRCLVYLKLVKVSLGSFIVGRGDFPQLLRLCLVQSPTLPTIEEGALLKLVSLELLCEDLVGLSGINIECHKHLEEVALDSMVNSETIMTWEDAAKKHPKRPRVLFFKKVCPNELGSSMVKYVATGRPAAETRCSVIQEDQQIPASQSISGYPQPCPLYFTL